MGNEQGSISLSKPSPDPDCGVCCGDGIMILETGEEPILAPCLECSPHRRLSDLEAERDRRTERAEIAEHNRRISEMEAHL